jgi:hypothetical protein
MLNCKATRSRKQQLKEAGYLKKIKPSHTLKEGPLKISRKMDFQRMIFRLV